MDSLSWTKRLAQCVGKEAFSTPQLANRVQRRRAMKRRTYKVKQEVYHCKGCGKFHIGTPAKSRQPAPAERKRLRFDIMEDDESMA